MKEERYVRLPEGFWQDYYRKEYGQSPDWPCIPSACLNREKSMRIVNERLDCMPFAHMEELKELVIHHRYLENFAAVADMPRLKRLILVDCD